MEKDRYNLRQQLNEVFETDIPSLHKKLVEMVKKWDGKIYLVGGAVRDELMGKESKDMDYLVTGIEREKLRDELLKTLPGSKVNEAGANFGIVIVNIGNDQFEFAIPRSDIDRDTVTTDPNLPVESDLLRRDLTINAMAKDLETGEIVGPAGFDAVSDIKNKIIRSVGDPKQRFDEDPLRILRALQFATRFGFTIEPKTLEAIKINADDLMKVSGERFKDEFYKAWTKGKKDTNYFFQLLDDTGIGRLMFGTDFDPIPISLRRAKEPFAYQNIAAFLRGGDYTVMNKSIDDQNDIVTARTLYDMAKNGFNVDQVKILTKSQDKFPTVLQAFKRIDNKLYITTKNILKKPLVPMKGDSWEKWMLPLKGGEIIEIAEEAGKPLKGKAISEATLALISAYQNGDIPVSGSYSKSRELAKDYLINKLLQNDRQLNDSVRIGIIQERIKNILGN